MSEYVNISTKDALKALIGVWHDANEAGCCDDEGPFCEASKWWARGYLAADLGEMSDGDSDRLAALEQVVVQVRGLAEKWNNARELGSNTKSIVLQAVAAEVFRALNGAEAP